MQMNSKPVSPRPVQTSFEPTPPSPGELLFSLEVPGRLPSWNEILGMEHWARYKFKDQLQLAFLYELQASGNAYSTSTTCAKNISLIAAGTLASYRETALQQRKLRSDRKKQSLAEQKLSESKSSKSKVPF